MTGIEGRPTGRLSRFYEREQMAKQPAVITFPNATRVTDAVSAEIEDAFQYHPWTPEQIEAGGKVRAILVEAVKVIIANVPPGPDRSVAIRKMREARMDANSAITHGGRY